MARTVLDILGTMLIVVGIAGFVSPDLAGAHLSPAHNFLHIALGAMALWIGLKGSPRNIHLGSSTVGAVLGLLGVAGFVFGNAGVASAADQPTDPRIITIIPDALYFGQSDHILNLAIALVFLAAAFLSRPSQETEPKHA